MKAPVFLSIALAGATSLVMCGSGSTSVPADTVGDATWLEQLAGRWEGEVGGQRYIEEWRKVDANTYEGGSATYDGARAVGTEQLRITQFAGQWLYLANPGGQGVTCFVRNSGDASTWIFENKEHDFPRRIGYKLAGDVLTAWIAGDNDQDHRMEFVLKRAK